MSNESNEASSPTLNEVVGVLLPHVEKIEEGFQAIRLTLEGLATQFGDAPLQAARPPSAAGPPASSSGEVEPPPIDSSSMLEPRRAPVEEPAAEDSHQPRPIAPADDHAPTPRSTPHQVVPNEPAASEEPMLPPTAHVRPAPIPVSEGQGGNMSQIIFGPQLTSVTAISGLSGELIAAMYADDHAAIGMIGQLMEFRTATTDRKAKMLKELGEAFYRWKPAGDPDSLDALIAWTHTLMDEAGLKNRIEIVRNGDRYDQQRHNAKERGVEVSDVLGWVVLRDNGKVYSKANVSVK